ncbi:MAG: hypothetical protein MUC28_00905 [Planctomycetes bacterium]|jgi:hypothetical protein|nr:hypothetical protein [Planctomycetota bacterium]
MNKKFLEKKLFLVVPKIIEQPTWGGDYILGLKKWNGKEPLRGLKIGQSYELYSGSFLRADLTGSADPDFTGMLGYAARPEEEIYQGPRNRLLSLCDLIKRDPAGILGQTAAKRGKNKLNLLIKFTQAKDNSFQLHIGRGVKSNKWRPKPESWFYFKPGLVTLGLKSGTDVKKYYQAVLALDLELRELSKQVGSGILKLTEAKKRSATLVKKYRPWQYVNKLKIKENEVIDLSGGGLHHSWEDDPKRLPLGNIIYELQLDVMDPISTIRSFDKGKFKSDGSLRPLDIDDYFRYLNTDSDYNRPANHILKPKIVFSRPGIKISRLMANPDYYLDKITLKGEYAGEHALTSQSFHHLFVQSGTVWISTSKESLELTAGHSCFICAASDYKLKTKGKAEILKSYIGL